MDDTGEVKQSTTIRSSLKLPPCLTDSTGWRAKPYANSTYHILVVHILLWKITILSGCMLTKTQQKSS